MPRPLKVFLA
ncbi:hypothetical protein RDABS01_013182 [Bienertia sinuspersici]